MSIQGRAAHLTFRGVLGAFIVAERKQQGAASDLFKLAKSAKTLEVFNAKCEEAEAFYLSDEAGQMRVESLPTKYVQARSDIRGAFSRGLDLSRIKSYHKMKQLKVEAGKPTVEQPEVQPAPQPTAQPDDSGVIVIGSEPDAAPAQDSGVIVEPARPEARERTPRGASMRDARESRRDDSLNEALAAGTVIYADSNMIIPPELARLIPVFLKLDEHSRHWFAKRWTKDVQVALSQRGNRAASQTKQRASR